MKKSQNNHPGIVVTRRHGRIRVDATSDLSQHPDFVAEWSGVVRIDDGRVRFAEVLDLADLPSELARTLTDVLQLPEGGESNP